MAKRPKPTLEQVLRLYQGAQSYWAAAHAQWREDLAMYWGEDEIAMPRMAEPEVSLIKQPYTLHMGEASELVDSLRGLLEAPSVISCDAPGVGSRAAKAAERIERFGNAYMAVVEFEQGGDVEASTLFEAGLLGLTFVEVLPDTSHWRGRWPKPGVDPDTGEAFEETPEDYNRRVQAFQRSAPFPITIRHRSATSAYPILDGKRVQQWLYVERVPAAFVESRYGRRLSARDLEVVRGLEPFEEVEILTVADDVRWGWYCFQQKLGWGAELRTWEHQMPLPEGQAPVVAYRGFTTSGDRPERRFKGVLSNIRPVLKAIDSLASRQMTMIGVYFWLTLIHKIKSQGAEPEDMEALRALRTFHFGGINHLLPEEALEVLGPPPHMPDAELMWSKLEQRMQRHWPPALHGLLEGSSSGYQYRMVRDLSLRKVVPVANNIAQGDADRFRLVLYAVGGLERLLGRQGPLQVYARYSGRHRTEQIGITWSEARDYLGLIKARRDPDMPEDVHSNLDAVGKAISLKMPPSRAWTKYGGVEDPEQMADEWTAYELEQMPEIAQRRAQDVLAAMDLWADEEYGMSEEEARADPGMPPTYGDALDASVASEGPAPEAGVPSPGNIGSGPRAGTRTEPPDQPAPPPPALSAEGG